MLALIVSSGTLLVLLFSSVLSLPFPGACLNEALVGGARCEVGVVEMELDELPFPVSCAKCRGGGGGGGDSWLSGREMPMRFEAEIVPWILKIVAQLLSNGNYCMLCCSIPRPRV